MHSNNNNNNNKHPAFISIIKFKDKVCEKNEIYPEILPFKLIGEIRDLRYEYEEKGTSKNRSHYNLARSLNSKIKNYYVKHYKDEVYFEPFINNNNSLLISASDAEKLHQQMPHLFVSYVLPKELLAITEGSSNPFVSEEEQQIQTSTVRIQQLYQTASELKKCKQPYTANHELLEINSIDASESLETKQYKRRKFQARRPINKEDVEMMVQKFETEQEALGKAPPQTCINKENAQAVFQNLIGVGKRKRIDHQMAENEQINNSEEEINLTSEEIVNYLEESIKQSNQEDDVISNVDIEEQNSPILNQNPFGFFAGFQQPQLGPEEGDVFQELAKFLQEEEKELGKDPYF